jgi:hypothetical protein
MTVGSSVSAYNVGQRVTDPQTGKLGKVVFISPVTKRVYVEFGRTSESWVTYSVEQLSARGDLFGPLEI